MRAVEPPQAARRVEASDADAWDSSSSGNGDVVQLLDGRDALRAVARGLAERPRRTAAWSALALPRVPGGH